MSIDKNDIFRKILEKLAKAEEVPGSPSDDDTTVNIDELPDLTDDFLDVMDPSTAEGEVWWELNFGNALNVILGGLTLQQLIKFLRSKGWSLRKIAQLFSKTKQNCPEGSTDPCCLALKRLGEIFSQWNASAPVHDMGGLVEAIGGISSVLASLAGCAWAREMVLAILTGSLLNYFLSLGLTEQQAMEFIKKLLEWIMGGGDPNLVPALIPNGEQTEPGAETACSKPNKKKIEDSVIDRLGDTVLDFAQKAAIAAAIAAIIAGAIIMCRASPGTCPQIQQQARLAMIAVYAAFGLSLPDEEAQIIYHNGLQVACAVEGGPVMSNNKQLKALSHVINKRRGRRS
jgi:hypothetical protein